MGTQEDLVLSGRLVRLEPLSPRFLGGLVTAAAADPSLYQWSPVPQGEVEAASYIDTADSSLNQNSAPSTESLATPPPSGPSRRKASVAPNADL